jgi:hypothetical protein
MLVAQHASRLSLALAAALTLGVLPGCSERSSSEAPEGPRLIDAPAATGCPHPLLPLIEGASWAYEVGADPGRTQTAELRVVRVEKRGSALTAEVRRRVGESSTTVEGVCGSEGTSFLAFFVPLGLPLPVQINYAPRITKRIGALLAPPSALKSGATWNYELVAHTEQPGGRSLTMDSSWQAHVEYGGERVVVVPAGRYDVTQLAVQVTGHHRPPEEEDVVFGDRVMDPPTMSYTYSLARGVGVVLIEGELDDQGRTRRARWALAGVTRP